MRRILATAAVLIAVGAFLFVTLGSKNVNTAGTYNIELQNAFGLVQGSDFKVAGVIAGSIQKIDLCKAVPHSHCQNALDALITVQVNQAGFGQFHADTTCQSRPQSLIGEYFVDCGPGTSKRILKPGSTIPVSQTQSTIPADLVQNVMRLPYRQRFSLIINELGAAVAARSTDLQTALRRADPALAQTDNLLHLLAGDANTIKQLNVGANHVITALAQNKGQVQHFIDEANRASTISASPQANSSCSGVGAACIEQTWNRLPGFLEQLRPAMQKLGAAADAQTPVFQNLQAAHNELQTFFRQLVPFSHSSQVSLACGDYGEAGCPNGGASLGTASQTGKPAVIAARPLARHLNEFARPTPELAQNLAIVLRAIDTRKRLTGSACAPASSPCAGGAVEPDPRSPDGGVGYTGLEGVLQYAFNITNAISYFTPYGHMLAVDGFANTVCSPYADQQSIANNLSTYQKGGGDLNSFNPQNPRTCYAWLGPNQQGVSEPDPSNPGACVPDPGGYPVQGYGTHYYGVKTNACKLQPNPVDTGNNGSPLSGVTGGSGGSGGGLPPLSRTPSGSSGSPNPTIGQIVSQLSSSGALGSASSVSNGSGASSGAPASGTQAQRLLNYLMAP